MMDVFGANREAGSFENMVKVITIMDDVYADLYRLKKSKGMSFSEVFRHLLKERRDRGNSILSFAASIEDSDIDHRAVDKVRKEAAWGR
jgi:predicted CopG family antitoxin